MRVKSVSIENFRSIRHLTCDFDSVTSLIGPNGAGKSNVLRALDWFFNGDKGSLDIADRHHGAEEGAPIRVRVDFEDLTDHDRQALGTRYCPNDTVETFTAWRTWDGIEDKISGRAKANLDFETVRAEGTAAARKVKYGEIREAYGMPAWTNSDAAEASMRSWELDHPNELVDAEVSNTHFFGINSRGVMSELFDFVFVSADLRASEETTERRDSLLERILRRVIDHTEFDQAVEGLTAEYAQNYQQLGDAHITDQLNRLAGDLTAEIATYSPGREVRIDQSPASVRPPAASVSVEIEDRGARTPVSHQGHGFQRTLLLAGLTVLSKQARENDQDTSMFLAIEEPELFQHPTQARAFASVLRYVADDPHQATQVVFATHSPYFVNPAFFDEVRRLSSVEGPNGCVETKLTQATVERVQERLSGFVDSDAVARRFEQVCLHRLPEALFAERVILVEGDEDAAILEGVGSRINAMAINGISVTPVAGKSGMMIPFAILELLGVDALMVVDNDSGCDDRMRRDGKDEDKIAEAMAAHIRDNRALCRFVGEAEDDFPVGRVGERLAFVPDTLETLLSSDMPGWDLSRRRLIDEGRGVSGKHAGTYALAVRECEEEPGPDLAQLANACLGNLAA